MAAEGNGGHRLAAVLGFVFADQQARCGNVVVWRNLQIRRRGFVLVDPLGTVEGGAVAREKEATGPVCWQAGVVAVPLCGVGRTSQVGEDANSDEIFGLRRAFGVRSVGCCLSDGGSARSAS
jgi:hypothetical protein